MKPFTVREENWTQFTKHNGSTSKEKPEVSGSLCTGRFIFNVPLLFSNFYSSIYIPRYFLSGKSSQLYYFFLNFFNKMNFSVSHLFSHMTKFFGGVLLVDAGGNTSKEILRIIFPLTNKIAVKNTRKRD